MIRPLRRRHRVLVASLAVLLPPAFVAGIAGRPNLAGTAPRPTALLDRPETTRPVQWSHPNLWPGHVIQTELSRSHGSPLLRLDVQEPPRPDTLLYWVGGAPRPNARLPDGAVLLGGVDRAAALPIPAVALGQPGYLLLYSLADREVVATSAALTLDPH